MAMKPRTFRRVVLIGSLASVVLVVLLGYFVVRPLQAQRTLESKRVEGMAAAQSGDYIHATKLIGQYLKRAESPDPDVILTYARSRAKVQTSDGGYLQVAIKGYRRYLRIRTDDVIAAKELLPLFNTSGMYLEAANLGEQIRTKMNDQSLEVLREEIRARQQLNENDPKIEPILVMSVENPGAKFVDIYKYVQWLKQNNRTNDANQFLADRVLKDESDIDSKMSEMGLSVVVMLTDLSSEEFAKRREELATKLAKIIQLNPLTGEWESEPLFLTREATVFLDSMFNGFGRPDLSLKVRIASSKIVRDTDSLIWSARRLYWNGDFEELALIDAINDEGEPVADVIGYQSLAAFMNDTSSSEASNTQAGDVKLEDIVLDFRAKPWRSFLDGVELLEQGKAVDARPMLTKAIAKYPSEPTFHLIAGDLSYQQGRFSQAVESWETAEQLVDGSVGSIQWIDPSLRIVNAYWTSGRLVEVTDRIDNLMRNPDTFTIALRAYAWLARSSNLGRDRAERILEKFELAVDGMESEQLALIAPDIATLYASVGQKDSACEVLRVGFEHDLDPELKVNLLDVDSYYSLGLADEFGIEPSSFVSASPEQAFRLVLSAYSEPQQVNDGLRILEQGIASAPDDDRKAWQLVRAKYLDLFYETKDQARNAWEMLREKYPADVELLYYMAESRAFSDDPDGVQEIIDQIVEITATVGKVIPARLRLAHAKAMVNQNATRSTRDRAIEIVRGVVSSEQQNIQARNILGQLLSLRPSPFLSESDTFEPNISEAIEQYMTISRQLVGRSAQNYLLEAIDLAYESGDTDSAKQYLNEYTTRYFEDLDLLPAAANRLETMNEFDDALAIYVRVYRRSQDGQALKIDAGLSMLNLLNMQSKRSQALTIFEEIKAVHQLSAEQLLKLASLYAKFDFKPEGEMLAQSGERYGLNEVDSKLVYAQYAKAFVSDEAYVDALKEITVIDPSNADVWKKLIQHAINTDNRDQAKLFAAQAQAANPQSAAFDALAELASGKIQLVADMLRPDDNRQSDPKLIEGARRYDAFIAAIETEPRETLISMLVSLLDDFPDYKLIQKAGLVELEQQGVAPDRLAFYAGKAARLYPSDSEILRIAGDAYIRSNKPNDAIEVAKLWRSNSVGSPEEADILGARALIQFGQFGDAVSAVAPYLVNALQSPDKPISLEVLWTHSLASIKAGENPREVANRLEPLLKENAQVRTQVWMNLVATSVEPQDEAVRWLEIVREFISSDEQEMYGDTWVLMLEGVDDPTTTNVKRAIDILEVVHKEELIPNADLLGFLARAYAMYAQGVSTQSVEESVVAYSKAARLMEQADQLDSSNLVYLARGAYFASLGKDYTLAEKMYVRLLERDIEAGPFLAVINNNLALAIEHQNPPIEKLEKALGMVQLAIKTDNQARYHGTQGWVELALDQLDSAEESFRYVVEQDPENIEGWVGLAIVYNRFGADKAEEAAFAIAQAVKLTESNPMSEELKSRLRNQGQPDWAKVFTD